jgi:hypothetical protein
MEGIIMNLIMKSLPAAGVALLAAAFAPPAIADPAYEGIVIGIHGEAATGAFVRTLALPDRRDGGRFAVVQLLSGGRDDAAFALVYVPARLGVRKNDVVRLAPTRLSPAQHPGRGVVVGVDPSTAACR